jgi:hypothetical protein
VSSFAINGRIVYDPTDGPAALAQAVPSQSGDGELQTRRGLNTDADPRLYVLELVAALAIELRGRGDQVTQVDVD